MENKKIIKNATLYLGDCLEVMKDMPNNSIDSIVTDPPYGLKFMGKKWDYDVPSVMVWKEAFRVLKPGGHLLSFGGARTYHRMVVNIENAGFDIRDQIMWIYGSGFPKSLNVSKAIDKAAGVLKTQSSGFNTAGGKEKFKVQDKSFRSDYGYKHQHTTDIAKQWDGWGTGLKPAHEPICVARKPITEKTIAQNILKYGTGGINIDKCRVPADENLGRAIHQTQSWKNTSKEGVGSVNDDWKKGRWPANIIHDGGLEVEKAFAKSGKSDSGNRHTVKQITPPGHRGIYGKYKGGVTTPAYTDSGTASRFFYCAKASKSERGEGNKHPTVKPIALMRYLVRLVTPPGGLVLDNHMGSGSTGIAACREMLKFIGIDNDEESFITACKRIKEAHLKRSK